MSKLRASTLLLRPLERLVDQRWIDRLAVLHAEPLHACRPCGRSRRCASGRLPATGRTSTRRGRPGGPSGRAAGCRCGGSRGARCRRRRGRRPRRLSRSALDARRGSRRRLGDLGRSRGLVATWRDLGLALLRQHLDVAAELDVGAAAGHVGGDGDRARAGRPGRRSRLPARGSGRSARCAGSCRCFSSSASSSDFSMLTPCRPAPAGRGLRASSISSAMTLESSRARVR